MEGIIGGGVWGCSRVVHANYRPHSQVWIVWNISFFLLLLLLLLLLLFFFFFFILKLASGEILLKELKGEATKMKLLLAVQSIIMTFFKIEEWEEAVTRFGTLVDADRLVRFTVSRQSKQNKITIANFIPKKIAVIREIGNLLWFLIFAQAAREFAGSENV